MKKPLIGGTNEPWCLIHGEQHYLPREETREDIRSRRARVTLWEFKYEEEDWDYALEEEETEDEPFTEADFYEYPPWDKD